MRARHPDVLAAARRRGARVLAALAVGACLLTAGGIESARGNLHLVLPAWAGAAGIAAGTEVPATASSTAAGTRADSAVRAQPAPTERPAGKTVASPKGAATQTTKTAGTSTGPAKSSTETQRPQAKPAAPLDWVRH